MNGNAVMRIRDVSSSFRFFLQPTSGRKSRRPQPSKEDPFNAYFVARK
jgi:hypothetical protein